MKKKKKNIILYFKIKIQKRLYQHNKIIIINNKNKKINQIAKKSL